VRSNIEATLYIVKFEYKVALDERQIDDFAGATYSAALTCHVDHVLVRQFFLM
jgi:hypothetical protein